MSAWKNSIREVIEHGFGRQFNESSFIHYTVVNHDQYKICILGIFSFPSCDEIDLFLLIL